MEFTGERFIPDCGLGSEIELEHLQRYLTVQDVVAEKRVLDAASGVGYGTAFLAKSAATVCGVDIDLEALAFAEKHYNSANLQYLKASISALPFSDDSFDVVVSFETIEHVDDGLHKKFLEEVLRVLTSEGFFIISTPDKHIYSELPGYKNEFHVREYYRQEFHDFLQQFFPNVVLLDQLQELAHIITNNRAGSCKVLRQEAAPLSGKYIMALCGRGDLPDSGKLTSIIFDREKSYKRKVDRVVELQGEIVEKNGNIADCWKMIHERDDIIAQINGELLHKDERHIVLDGQIIENVRKLAKKEQTIQQLREEQEGMQADLDKLSASLSHIYSTNAWKIVQKIYWLKNKICRL